MIASKASRGFAARGLAARALALSRPGPPGDSVTGMRYLVTGATGFVGREVVRQLLGASFEVVALARDPAAAAAGYADPLARPGVTLARGDVTDKESMRAAMTGVDGVFHVAGWYRIGARHKTPAFTTNVDGSRNVLELAGELGVAKTVYTSSLAVNSDTHGRMADESYHFTGRHLSAYDLTKWRAHYEVAVPLMAAGLPLVIVAPGAVYGPGDHGPLADVFRLYLRGELPLLPKRCAYCWGYVTDIARAHLVAMEKGVAGQSYIISGPCHELSEALRLLQKMTGLPLPRRSPPPALLKGVAAALSLIERFHPGQDMTSAEAIRVMAGVTYLGSNAKAKRELGIEMRPLEEGLRQSLSWYREYAHTHGNH